MDIELKKRQVNYEQLTGLLEFMREHHELAKGLARGRRGKYQTMKIWNQCAKKLNTIADGAIKDGKGWSKYWCDWKYRVRRRALEIKAANDQNRSMADGTVPLSLMEENILSIIGENAVEGITIKSDPLEDRESENEDHDINLHNDDVTMKRIYETKARRSKRKRRRQEPSVDTDMEDNGDSSPTSADRQPNRNENESDNEAMEFLRLEKKNLETTRKMLASLETIGSELSKLTDVMADIRDCLINRVNV